MEIPSRAAGHPIWSVGAKVCKSPGVWRKMDSVARWWEMGGVASMWWKVVAVKGVASMRWKVVAVVGGSEWWEVGDVSSGGGGGLRTYA